MSGTIAATGVAKRIFLAPETAFGTPVLTGGKTLRRVNSDLTLGKESYQSQEILSSQQIRDARHGVRRPTGTFAGQLSPGSFDDFWEGLLRADFATGVILTGQSLTLAVTAGTLTGTGFLAAGLKRSDVIKLSGAGAPNAAINGKNLRISALSATVITTPDLPSGLTDGSLTGVTITVVGKKLMIPATGQIYKSYTLEHWFSDIGISELFTGVRFGQTAIALPASGLVTFNTQIMGQNMAQNTAQQMITPSAPTSSSSLAGVNGKLRYNGADIALVTGINLSIAPTMEAPAVLGSNIAPFIFQGPFVVNGSFTALFTDEVLANTFINEVEVALDVMLAMGDVATSDFMRITLPRIKPMSNQKSDGTMSLIQTMNFTALEQVSDTSQELTTMVIQDSLAVG